MQVLRLRHPQLIRIDHPDCLHAIVLGDMHFGLKHVHVANAVLVVPQKMFPCRFVLQSDVFAHDSGMHHW